MVTYDFDAPVERRGTDSVKFDCATLGRALVQLEQAVAALQ